MRVFLFLVVGLSLYAGLYYSAGPKIDATEVVPRTRNYSLGKVLRHFILGLAALFVIDGTIFHSGFYTALLKRDSYAGNIALVVAQERARPRDSAKQEIALVGDSRMVEGFSAKAADARTANSNFRIINLAAPQCQLRVWYYVLRALDPRADRYRAIVIPVAYDDLDRSHALIESEIDIGFAAPFLRCTDALDLARSFPKWPGQSHAFIACFLRGYAFRDDLGDLLTNWRARLASRKKDRDFLHSNYEYAGLTHSLAGVTFDSATKELFVPEHLSALRATLQDSITPRKNRGLFKNYRAQWLHRILEHYAQSSTTILFARMPRGPLGAPAERVARETSINEFTRPHHAFALDAHLFDRLERPELFADRSHLNTNGRAIFTQILTDELLNRFEPATPQ